MNQRRNGCALGQEVEIIRIVVDPFPSEEALGDLWLSAWGSAGPASFAPVLSRSLAHVGAYDLDRLVGSVNVAWDGGIHAFILDTSVHADYQRQGIATRMVREAEGVARQRGAKWLHVDFEPQLAAFYERCGFRPTAAGLIVL
jgi:GNAT superfamily N-acetyltransferase